MQRYLILILIISYAHLLSAQVKITRNEEDTVLRNELGTPQSIVIPKDTIPIIIDDTIGSDVDTLLLDEEITNISQHIINVDYYKIVILLPFMLDKNKGYYSTNMDDKSKSSLYLYEGIRIALDSLSRMGLYADVSILDNTENANPIDSLFRTEVLQKAELVIGPVYNPSIRAALKHNKAIQLPIVSPLSPTPDLAADNPYFLQLNPSLETLQESLVKQIFIANTSNKIYIINSNDEDENSRKNVIKKIVTRYKEQYGWNVELIELDIQGDWSYLFDTINQNVMIVNSFKESFLTEVSKKIESIITKPKFAIYGMPNWRDVKSMNTLFKNQSIYAIVPYYINKGTNTYQVIVDKFKKTNNLKPNETIVKGFDMMMFLGNGMLKNGKNFWQNIDQTPYYGIASDIEVVKKINANGTINYLENKKTITIYFDENDKTWYKLY